MKQTSMFSYTKSTGGLRPGTPIVDLFCGIGGFSCGAKLAGHTILLGVDSDPFLLYGHVMNNRKSRHQCLQLPSEHLRLPTEGPWHLHASPPCQKLSIMVPNREESERGEAVDLVAWVFELVKNAKPSLNKKYPYVQK